MRVLYLRVLRFWVAQVPPMHYPMYTVHADVLLKMTKVEPHEQLKALGIKRRIERRAPLERWGLGQLQQLKAAGKVAI